MRIILQTTIHYIKIAKLLENHIKIITSNDKSVNSVDISELTHF